jgi:hypothetical protein
MPEVVVAANCPNMSPEERMVQGIMTNTPKINTHYGLER